MRLGHSPRSPVPGARAPGGRTWRWGRSETREGTRAGWGRRAAQRDAGSRGARGVRGPRGAGRRGAPRRRERQGDARRWGRKPARHSPEQGSGAVPGGLHRSVRSVPARPASRRSGLLKRHRSPRPGPRPSGCGALHGATIPPTTRSPAIPRAFEGRRLACRMGQWGHCHAGSAASAVEGRVRPRMWDTGRGKGCSAGRGQTSEGPGCQLFPL